jgi:hypothetical protein
MENTDQVKAETDPSRSTVDVPKDSSEKAEPSFTPGPWSACDFEGIWVSGPDGSQNVVCDIVARKYENHEDDSSAVFTDEDYANARLIAAAPALYAAAQRALGFLQTLNWDGEEVRILTAALALARGSAPEREAETQ